MVQDKNFTAWIGEEPWIILKYAYQQEQTGEEGTQLP
jgi:hypothetical protein